MCTVGEDFYFNAVLQEIWLVVEIYIVEGLLHLLHTHNETFIAVASGDIVTSDNHINVKNASSCLKIVSTVTGGIIVVF